MVSIKQLLSKKFHEYSQMQQMHIRGVCLILFTFLVFCSIVFQIQLQYELKAKIKLSEKMQEECTREEIHSLVEEMKCFPVRKDSKGKEKYFFENGYGAARSYGGKRTHQGIDIMTSNNTPGYFQVQSVCDGVVEKIGWLRLGGYRIGIRSKSGLYYYYAHLDKYEEGIVQGKKVSAGDIIGYMGNTGYGKEGTKGKFDVHLHFGIYRLVNGSEKSLNPYYILKYISN